MTSCWCCKKYPLEMREINKTTFKGREIALCDKCFEAYFTGALVVEGLV